MPSGHMFKNCFCLRHKLLRLALLSDPHPSWGPLVGWAHYSLSTCSSGADWDTSLLKDFCFSSRLADYPIFQTRVTYPVSSSPSAPAIPVGLLASCFVSLLTIHCISDPAVRMVSAWRSLGEVFGPCLCLLLLKMSSTAVFPLCPSCFHVPLGGEPFPGTSDLCHCCCLFLLP